MIADDAQTCAREETGLEPWMKNIVDSALSYVSGTRQERLQ